MSNPEETTQQVERDFEDVITCPYCDVIQETESTYKHMTVQGTIDTDKPKKMECEDCGLPFLVHEMVSRSWKTEMTTAE